MRGNLARYHLFLICLAAAAYLLASDAAAFAKSPKTLKTHYSTITYPEEKTLLDFGSNIAGKGELISRGNPTGLASIAGKVDKIVFRVKTLLDMYPAVFHFEIQVMRTYAEVEAAFHEAGAAGKAPIAFYSHKTNTIYLTVERLHGGILAHEIAHAVINAYFDPPPPSKMQEILAQYVDRHLWEE